MTPDVASNDSAEGQRPVLGEGTAPGGGAASLRALLDQGIAAAKHGQVTRARRAFEAALAADPANEEAWLWLAAMTEDHDLARAMYQRVLLAYPDSSRAQAGLRWLDQAAAQEERSPTPLAGKHADAPFPGALPTEPSPESPGSTPEPEHAPEPAPERAASIPPFGPDEGPALFVPPWEREAVVPVWGPGMPGPMLAPLPTEPQGDQGPVQASPANSPAEGLSAGPPTPSDVDAFDQALAVPTLTSLTTEEAGPSSVRAEHDALLSESLAKEPEAAMVSTVPPVEEEPSVATPTPLPQDHPVPPPVTRTSPAHTLRNVVMLAMLSFVLLGSLALAVVLASETQAGRVRAALGVSGASPAVVAGATGMPAAAVAGRATAASQATVSALLPSAGVTLTQVITTSMPASITTTLAITATPDLPLTRTIGITASLAVTTNQAFAGVAITSTGALTMPGAITSTGVFTAPWATERYRPLPLDEKWIEVDLGHQKLNAFEGTKIVFSTRISSGKSRTPTVLGKFRIQRKFEATLMAGPGYYLPNVPWTMYFYGGYALHGAYWHHNWGTPMSHGCVNLSIEDSKWLYQWTGPVARGDRAVMATADNPGTWVVIHP